jgi:hypothetical protein
VKVVRVLLGAGLSLSHEAAKPGVHRRESGMCGVMCVVCGGG